jgi:hypothetical protein
VWHETSKSNPAANPGVHAPAGGCERTGGHVVGLGKFLRSHRLQRSGLVVRMRLDTSSSLCNALLRDFQVIVRAQVKPVPGLDRTLAGLGLPLMLIDLRMARQDKDALAWLSTRRSLDAVISTNFLVTPSTASDGLFFVNRLTPAIATSDRTR